MKNYQAVLWDVDGTLLDFLAAERVSLKKQYESFGFGICDDARIARYSAINVKYWERLERGEITKKEVLEGRFREFLKKEGVDPKYAEEFSRAYESGLPDTIVFCDNSKEIVTALKGKIYQAVVSNGTIPVQSRKLKESGLGELMDGIFLSEQVGYEKPALEFFDAVFAAMPDIPKEEILIVGDSLTSDMLGGERAGIDTCWYNPRRLPKKIEVRTDYEITDLCEVLEILGQK